MGTQKLSTIIALVVTTVWALSFIADIFVPGYNPSPFVHLAMMTVVGAIFGRNFLVNASQQAPPDPNADPTKNPDGTPKV